MQHGFWNLHGGATNPQNLTLIHLGNDYPNFPNVVEHEVLAFFEGQELTPSGTISSSFGKQEHARARSLGLFSETQKIFSTLELNLSIFNPAWL